MRAKRGARKISRTLLRMRRMDAASIRLASTKKEWNAHNRIWSRALDPLAYVAGGMDFLSLVIWSSVFWLLL